MSRDELLRAVEEVEAAADAADAETGSRLARLADQLRSQAERDATPALGALDRIQTKLREIGAEADDAAVGEPVARARDHVFSFLGTLDDRGMRQHGGRDTGSDEDA